MNWKRKQLFLAAAFIFSSSVVLARDPADQELLRVREQVWRAWFAGDTETLKKLVPPGTIAISSGEKQWQDQAQILHAAAEFHRKGGRLVRLEFPRTEVPHFEDVAVTYSEYVYEVENGGKRSMTAGRVTEVFTRRNGQWTNPGWHTDEEK